MEVRAAQRVLVSAAFAASLDLAHIRQQLKPLPVGKFLPEVITVVQPETLLKWHRRLIANKWDFSGRRKAKSGRPPIPTEVEQLVVQFAQENPAWGYDRIAGALANVGYRISEQTIGNILKRHGLGIAPERQRTTSWAEFIRRHREVLWATDFFTTEVWTCSGLTTFYVLFFLHMQTRKVVLGGVTPYQQEAWLKQVARNLTVADGPLSNARFLLHDQDTKFSEAFDEILRDAGVTAIKLPSQSPSLNAFAERWVCSVKEECLNQLILFGERSLRHPLNEYLIHHQTERNHQGIGNVIPFPQTDAREAAVERAERLGGLLNFYYRAAA